MIKAIMRQQRQHFLRYELSTGNAWNLYIIRTISLWTARVCLWTTRGPGRTDGVVYSIAALQRLVAVGALGRFDGSGAPESHLTGLADPPEDWPAAIPSCDAAAVITRESKSAILARKL